MILKVGRILTLILITDAFKSIREIHFKKSGLMVFGFCPAGSTHRDFFRISRLFPGEDRFAIVVYKQAVA